ncbi:MAG: hypothetical protein Q7S74_03300 [Nanoarchaeota archaeon]|nr:hypothetical protein [Nanoarchaeota archaeon]
MEKNKVLEELLNGKEISSFSKNWIENSNTNEEKIRQAYLILNRIGVSDKEIVSQAQLLGKDPETIERNHKRLRELGISNEKIATNANLLGMSLETMERNYQYLRNVGLKDSKIVSRAELLGMSSDTIERNYKYSVGLLRQNPENRNSGRDLLMMQAQLLGNSPKTINANVQYLSSLGIDYNNGLLLGTTPKQKRRKMAWLLREIFDYRNSEYKKETIHRMRKFVRENPIYLIKSITTLERYRDKIKEKAGK